VRVSSRANAPNAKATRQREPGRRPKGRTAPNALSPHSTTGRRPQGPGRSHVCGLAEKAERRVFRERHKNDSSDSRLSCRTKHKLLRRPALDLTRGPPLDEAAFREKAAAVWASPDWGITEEALVAPEL